MQLLRDAQVAKLLGVSRRQVWKLLSAGLMPEPVRVGGSVRWRETDIQEWIRQGCPAPKAVLA
jgi:prophage regulatory protein